MKILETYNFEKQTTFGINGEVTSATVLGEDKIAIANDIYIKIYNVFDENPRPFYFTTFGDVYKLLYCKAGNYLISLENFASFNDVTVENSSKQLLKVRVYTNLSKVYEDYINSDDTSNKIPLIVPRIASKVSPKSHCKGIEMIELDSRESPDMVTCSQETGNILVKSKIRLYIYVLRECRNDIQHFQYLDFQELNLSIHLNFMPIQLAMVENICAAISKKTCAVFEICMNDELNYNDARENDDSDSIIITDQTTTCSDTKTSYCIYENNSQDISVYDHKNINNYDITNPSSCMDTTTTKQQGKQFIDYQLALETNNEYSEGNFIYEIDSTSSQILLTSLQQQQKDIKKTFQTIEDYPVDTTNIKIQLHNLTNDNSKFKIKKLLYIQMASLQNDKIYIGETFTCIDLKPIYIVNKLNNENIKSVLQSKHYCNCIGYSFIITTTASDGYLYQFPINKTSTATDDRMPLTKYQFTAQVLDIVITDFVVHAITNETIETVTSRIGHKLFMNLNNDNTISNNFELSVPPPDMAIFCMKLHTFLNTKFSLSTNKNLILISSNDNSITKEWTIYNLIMPDPIQLTTDLEQCSTNTLQENLLNNNNLNSAAIDLMYELLSEGNVILRLAKYLDLQYNDEYLQRIDEMFIKNCRQLADLGIRSEKEEQYSDAIGYYNLCQISPYQIYESCLLNSSTNRSIGLLYTMKTLIINLAKNRTDSHLYLEYHRSLYDEKTSNQQISFGLELFNYFCSENAELLAIIGLKSIQFLNCNLENYLIYYEYLENRTCYEDLLYSLALCRHKNYDKSLQIIKTTTRQRLFVALRYAWEILFDDYQQIPNDKSFSEFTEKILFNVIGNVELVECISDIFIFYLCVSNKIDIKFIYDIFVNYFSLHINDSHNNFIPRRICETILSSYFYELFSAIQLNQNDDNTSPKQVNEKLCEPDECTTSLSTTEDDDDDDDVGESLLCDTNYEILNSNCNFNEPVKITFHYEQLITNCYERNSLILLLRLCLGNLSIATKKLNDSKNFNKILVTRNQLIMDLVQNKIKMNRKNFISITAEKLILPTCILPNYNDEQPIKFIRPILCLDERPNYLNLLPPFETKHFCQQNFIGYDDEIIVWVIKIQCLLCSKKIDYIVPDFLQFIQKNLNLIGIDSFLSILLPYNICIKFLIKFAPIAIYDYTKLYQLNDAEYQTILRSLINHCRMPLDQEFVVTIEQYKSALQYILNRLFDDRTFESFLNCLPIEEVVSTNQNIPRNISDSKNCFGYNEQLCDWSSKEFQYFMDSVDETNIFQLMLRKGIAKQRSIALNSMIVSTGKQLFEASN